MLRDAEQQRQRSESLQRQVGSLLEVLGDLALNEQKLLHKIVKYTLTSKYYDECFEHAFFPIREKDYCCSYCLNVFSKHLQLFPCRHRICEDCVQEHFFSDFCCPCCKVVLTDVFLDRALIERQMSEKVHCVHYETTKEAHYDACLLSYKRFADTQRQRLIEDFNANKISFQHLNQLRNSWLLENPALIEHIVCGQNQAIQSVQIQRQEVKHEVMPCAAILEFKNMQNHLELECSHGVRQCPHAGCEQSCSPLVLALHCDLCEYRELSCSICYRRIGVLEFNTHITKCVEALEIVCLDAPHRIPDVELALKIRSVQQAARELTQKVQMWDNVVQKQVIDALGCYKAPEGKQIVSSRFSRVLQFLYKDHILTVSFATQVLTLSMLDCVEQFSPLDRPYWAIGMCAFEFLNLFFFLFYVASFVFSNQYRSALAGYMFAAYFVGIVDCGMIYTLLQFTDNKSISIHRSSVITTFFDLFYYAAVVGCSIGFGDVVSGTLFVKIVTVIEIYYTQLICKMVFRGLSFYIKERDLEENRL